MIQHGYPYLTTIANLCTEFQYEELAFNPVYCILRIGDVMAPESPKQHAPNV